MHTNTVTLRTGLQVQLTVKRDFEGYFERLVLGWLERVAVPKHREIRITAGPYRSDVVSYVSKDGMLALDFYSAFRAGFGSLSETEVEEIIALM